MKKGDGFRLMDAAAAVWWAGLVIELGIAARSIWSESGDRARARVREKSRKEIAEDRLNRVAKLLYDSGELTPEEENAMRSTYIELNSKALDGDE